MRSVLITDTVEKAVELVMWLSTLNSHTNFVQNNCNRLRNAFYGQPEPVSYRNLHQFFVHSKSVVVNNSLTTTTECFCRHSPTFHWFRSVNVEITQSHTTSSRMKYSSPACLCFCLFPVILVNHGKNTFGERNKIQFCVGVRIGKTLKEIIVQWLLKSTWCSLMARKCRR